jgi:outer membrane protein
VNKLIARLFALLLIVSPVAFAADTAKIGFVDGAKIIAKYEPQIDSKLQQEFKTTTDKLSALQKQLVEENDKYKRDAATMSPDQMKTLQASFEKNQAEFQRLSAELNQKRSARANEELEKLLAQVRDASSKVSAKDGYTLILQRGAAIYVKDNSTDITDKVLALVQYK